MKLLTFFFLFSSLYGVTIHNDSTYPLTATVYSKENRELTSIEIGPSHTVKWQDSFYGARAYTKGPYRIVFTCLNGDEYGTISKIARNAKVYAQRSRGRKRCAEDSKRKLHRDFEDNQPHWKY